MRKNVCHTSSGVYCMLRHLHPDRVCKLALTTEVTDHKMLIKIVFVTAVSRSSIRKVLMKQQFCRLGITHFCLQHGHSNRLFEINRRWLFIDKVLSRWGTRRDQPVLIHDEILVFTPKESPATTERHQTELFLNGERSRGREEGVQMGRDGSLC